MRPKLGFPTIFYSSVEFIIRLNESISHRDTIVWGVWQPHTIVSNLLLNEVWGRWAGTYPQKDTGSI